MDDWEKVKTLKGKTLNSLTQGKQFLVSDVNDQFVKVVPDSSGSTWTIQKEELLSALNRLYKDRYIAQRTIDEQYANHRSTYTLAILQAVTNAKFYKEGNAAFIKLP